jgi:hypothetical protein
MELKEDSPVGHTVYNGANNASSYCTQIQFVCANGANFTKTG